MHWQFHTNLLGGNIKDFDLTQSMEYVRTAGKVILSYCLLQPPPKDSSKPMKFNSPHNSSLLPADCRVANISGSKPGKFFTEELTMGHAVAG